MSKKMSNKKVVPFDLFTALKIQAGIEKGRFVTRGGQSVKIVHWSANSAFPITGLLLNHFERDEVITFTLKGDYINDGRESSRDLMIELYEEEDEK